MEDPDWLSSPSSSVAAPPSVKFTYGSKSSSSSVSVRALGPAPTAVTHESEPKKGKEQSRRPIKIKQTSTSSTTGATSRSVFLSDENEDPVVTLDKEQSQNTATSLQPTKGGAKSKKGQKIPSSIMDISAHEESLTKINDNNDDDDLSHRSVSSSRTESALLQALTRLSIATSSSSSISSSASARTSEKNHPSKMSTKKRGFLKDRIAQGIRKSLAPGTNISKLSSATPSSSLSRSSIPRAPHSSSSTSSSSFTSNSLTDVSSSLKNKTTKNEIVDDDDDDDAISRISLPSTITDSRKARLKGRAVGFADVVSVSVSGGDLVDSDDEDCGSQHSSYTRKFGGRSRTTSFRRSSGASFSSLSTKSEYKTDDEDFNNYSNHGGNEIASDSDLDDDDTYESRNIDTEEAMKKAFKRISLAPAAFAAAKACRASVSGSHSRFSAFMNEKVVEEEEEEEDSSVLTCDTTTTTITTTTSSELVFGTILSSIFEYLSSKDIISSTSLVSKTWFAQSTHILSWRAATDMTFSNYKKNSSQGRGVGGKKHMNASERAAALVSSKRSWAAFLECYPWGKFLAEGAYKSVYKVWSAPRRRMEAISVMDINAIAETGNLPVIQAEIQAACLLSHLVRTNVCPNFLNTFQVFVFGASPSNQEDDDFQGLWGSPTSGHEEEEGQQNRDDSCPFDSVYIPNVTVAKQILSSSTSSTSQSALLHKRAKKCSLLIQSLKEQLPSQFTSTTTSQGASYQYIRMELCSSGDVEELLRRREPGVLALEMEACKASVGNRGGEAYRAAQLALQRADAQAANDAAQMAFQMAFSLYAARERLSFRHFDVKLLNFLAKPAVDLAKEEVHEKNVIEKSDSTSIVRLCYSIGERNVNVDLPLRGESKSGRTGSGQEDDDLSSSGHIIKLADYGTANTNPNTIEKPVHYTHFTTLENSPPEYLILGDAATQGYGADTWALGLCILHLFTGSCPYEEMMTTVSRDEDEELLLSQETNSAGATQKSSTNGKKSNVIGVVCPQPLKDALRKVWMTTEVSSVSTTSSSSGTLQKEKSTKTSAKSKKVIESTTIPTTSSSSAAAFEQNDSIKRKAVCRAFFTSLGVSAEWIAEDEVGVCDATTTAFPSSSSSSSNASYRVIRKVLESSGDVEETADILADTLYRYAVLLGLPEEDKNKDGNCSYATSNPVWVLLNAACKGIESLSCASSLGTFDDSDATKGGTKKQVKNKTTAKKSTKKNENVTSNSPSSAILLTLSEITACSLQYKADQRFASVKLGTNFLLQRARRRSDALFFSSQLHVSKKDSRLKSSLSTSTSLKGTGDSVKTGCCNLLLDLVCSNKNGLLAWNVKARPTMASFIQNEVLHNGVMFEQQSNGDNRIDKDEEENIIFEKKISYYGNSQGGQNCLPCDV